MNRGLLRHNVALSNVVGAFADCAVLLPIVILLTRELGWPLHTLLISAGIAAAVSGVLFKVPMALQPLKSLCVVAVALGATQLELQASGFIFGAICLALALTFRVDGFAAKVPNRYIHGLQFGLGLTLLAKGLLYAHSALGTSLWAVAMLGLVVALIVATRKGRFPIFGLLAFAGFVYAISANGSFDQNIQSWQQKNEALRPSVIASLVLPQIALTLANSVVGTQKVAKEYFGKGADRVTCKSLLLSIGFGNVVMAFFSGLPFCHGAGGLTAQVKSGATHYFANIVLGASLVTLGLLAAQGVEFSLVMPGILLSLLLIHSGVMHSALAWPSLSLFDRHAVVAAAIGAASVALGNLLGGLVFGAALELVFVGAGKLRLALETKEQR